MCIYITGNLDRVVFVGVFGESKRGFAGSSIVYFFTDRKTTLYIYSTNVLSCSKRLFYYLCCKNRKLELRNNFFYFFERTAHIVSNRQSIEFVYIRTYSLDIPSYDQNSYKYIKLFFFSSKFSRPSTFCFCTVGLSE